MSLRNFPAALLLFVLAAAIPGRTANAQQVWSHGSQQLRFSYAECQRKSEGALASRGFTIVDKGSMWTVGNKTAGSVLHTAELVCSPAPDGMWVNIAVVSAGTTDGTVPGLERLRMQQYIGADVQEVGKPPIEPPPPPVTPPPVSPPPPPPPPSAPAAFNGKWDGGGDWGIMDLHQAGNVLSGSYSCCGTGAVNGTVSGRTARFHWSNVNGNHDQGEAIIQLQANNDFLGNWCSGTGCDPTNQHPFIGHHYPGS